MRSTEQEAADPATPAARLKAIYREQPSLGRLIAENPAAPPELLEAMSHTTDTQLLTLLIKNPNAPSSVLSRWAEGAPIVFLQNPAVPLLLLEHPDLFYKLSVGALRTMFLAHPDPPTLVFEAAIERPELHWDLSTHPKLSQALLARLSESSDEKVRLRVARHPKTSAALLARLLEDGYWLTRRAAAEHPDSPAEHFALLRRAGSAFNLKDFATRDETLSEEALLGLSRGGPWAQRLAACHPNTPAETVAALFPSVDLEAQIEILQSNHKLPEALLHNLLRGSVEHRKLLARGELSTSLFNALAEDESPIVRFELVSNPSAPAEILAALAADKSIKIRKKVAAHPSTSPHALRALAKDGSLEVRAVLASRRDLSREVFAVLCKDESDKVRAALSQSGAIVKKKV